ncbi:hypothetical protein MTO96_043828 [Rhipicephalus appendiculatus]
MLVAQAAAAARPSSDPIGLSASGRGVLGKTASPVVSEKKGKGRGIGVPFVSPAVAVACCRFSGISDAPGNRHGGGQRSVSALGWRPSISPLISVSSPALT